MGYANITPKEVSGGQYSGGGSSFLAVGGSGYCLKDFKILNGGGEYGEADFITFVQTTIAKVDDAQAYYWDTEYDAWAYKYADGGHPAEEPVTNADLEKEIPAGTGFLCNFKTAGAKLSYSGEVNAGTEGKIVCGRAGQYTYVVNPNPYDISLAEMTITNPGGDYGEADFIIFMQNGIAKVDDARAYYWDTEYNAWAYKYADGGHPAEEPVASPSEIKLKAGEAVLFNSRTAAARVVVNAPVLK